MPAAMVAGAALGGIAGAGALGATAATLAGGSALAGAVGGASLGSMFGSSKKASGAQGSASKSAKIQNQIALETWQNYLSRYDPIAAMLAYDVAGIQPQVYDEDAGEWVADEDALEQIQQYKARQKARTEEQVARAGADVGMAAQAGRESQAREMARLGLRPGDPRYQGISAASRLREALAKAGARTDARRTARQDQIKESMDLLAIGKGLPATASGAAGGAARTYSNLGQQYANAAQGAGQFAGYAFGGGLPGVSPGTSSPTAAPPSVNYAPSIPQGGGLAPSGPTAASLYSPQPGVL